MQRKVIQQGNGTLTITLPKDWAKNQSLKGGDEVRVECTNDAMVIRSPEKEKYLNKISVDVGGMAERVMRSILKISIGKDMMK